MRFSCLFLLLPFLLLTACEGNTRQRKAARGANFVSDPDHLYFKNVRARHYRAEEVDNRATIYRHDDLYASPANFRLALIDNWLDDRATLRYEVNAAHPAWELQIATDSSWVPIELPVPPSAANLTLLNDHLLSPRALRLVSPTDTLPAFPEDRGRTDARFVVADYLRLIGG